MTDYEYAQAVMKAAGVVHDKQCNCCACAGCSGLAHCTAVSIYPDPLTSGDAFLALIEALRGRGLWVFVTISDSNGSGYRVEIRRGFHGDGPYAWADTFQAALVEAAGQALGVTR